jgi:hypothetical protein
MSTPSLLLLLIKEMERNFNLVRQILLQVEATKPGTTIQKLTCEGFDKATIIEHVDIMIEADLLDGIISKTMAGSSGFLVRKITWKGHDFIANAKNDTVWKKVMTEAKEKGSSVSLVVLNGLLTKAAQKYAGLD